MIMSADEKFKETPMRDLVAQSNQIIQSSKKFDLMGLRLFLIGLMSLNPHYSENDKYYDEDFPRVLVSPQKLIEIFGNNTYLHDLQDSCTKLFGAHIVLPLEHGGWRLVHLFDTLEYVPNEGLHICFDERMKPYLLDFVKANGYTIVSAEQLFRLSSPYGVRLLEMLLQFRNIRPGGRVIKRSVDIINLRFILDVPTGAYEGRMNNFRKFVLDEPIREINVKTDYRMSYKVVKTGRKVTGFEFTLDTSKVPTGFSGEEYVIPDNWNVLKKLKSLGFGEKAAKNILDKCDDATDCIARTDYAIQALERQKKKSPVKNETGFLRKAIEENWLSRNPPEENPVEQVSRRKENSAPVLLEEILDKKTKSKTEKPEPIEEPQTKGDNRSEEELRQDAEKTGVNFDDFRDNEKPVYPSLLEILKKNFLENPNSPTADVFLKKFNMTSERFKELYM